MLLCQHLFSRHVQMETGRSANAGPLHSHSLSFHGTLSRAGRQTGRLTDRQAYPPHGSRHRLREGVMNNGSQLAWKKEAVLDAFKKKKKKKKNPLRSRWGVSLRFYRLFVHLLCDLVLKSKHQMLEQSRFPLSHSRQEGPSCSQRRWPPRWPQILMTDLWVIWK